MRISRKRRPDKPLIPHYNLNDNIRVPEVRLIDSEGKNLGVFTAEEAVRMAREQELDLVEINPKAVPPVAQMTTFSHFKYQKEKEMKKQKASAHVTDTKGIRLSVRIGDHDLDIRCMQAEKFLSRGDKVKAEIILRGREHARPELAFGVIRKFIEKVGLTTPLRIEQEITKQGNKVTAIVTKR